jgi:hypothetical protein
MEPSREDLLAQIAALNAENLSLRDRLAQAEDQSDFMGGSLKARTRALSERVKELECAFACVQLLRDPDLKPEQKLGRIVDLLPKALQRPEAACARAVVGEREFRTARFAEGPHAVSETISARGEAVGTLEVRYLRPPVDFLPEELKLLKVAALCLGALCEEMP